MLIAFMDGTNLSGAISAIALNEFTSDFIALTNTNKPKSVLNFILTPFIIRIDVDNNIINTPIDVTARFKVS